MSIKLKKIARKLSNIIENIEIDKKEFLYIKYQLLKPVLTIKQLKELNSLYETIEERLEQEFLRLEKVRLELTLYSEGRKS